MKRQCFERLDSIGIGDQKVEFPLTGRSRKTQAKYQSSHQKNMKHNIAKTYLARIRPPTHYTMPSKKMAAYKVRQGGNDFPL